MRDRSLQARREMLLREEAKQPETWWWLSFANDSGFLGGVLTRARGFVSAVDKAHRLGINPGGQVKGAELPPTPEQHTDNFKYADRLLSKEEIEEAWGVEKW